MSGPYGYDIEFAITVGVVLFVFLCVGAAIELYLEAKKK